MQLKRIALLSFSVGMIFITLAVYFKRTFVSGGDYGETDFYKFYESILFYFSGQDIYSDVIVALKRHAHTTWVPAHADLNPPFFTLLLLPLHFFNYATAYQVWNTFSAACILLGGALALKRFPQWHKNTLPFLALFLLYAPNSETLAYGQITGVLLVILAAAWLLARNKHDVSAGFLIGFACALKLFCGLFLIYFLCLKRFRLIVVALITMLVAFLLGGAVFGFQAYLHYHATLHDIGWYAASLNESFYGFFLRLFSNTEKNQPLIIAPYLVNFFTIVCSGLLAGYLIWFWKKWGEQKFDVGFSLVIVSMILLSPLGWIYYFPLLVIPYLVVVAEGNVWTHLAACFLLFASTQTGDFLAPTQIKTMTQLFVLGGMGFYVLLGMLGLLYLVGRGVQRSEKYLISENLWLLIYAVIFIPSLVSLWSIAKSSCAVCY